MFSTYDGRLVHAAVLDLETAATPTFAAIRRFKRLNPGVALIAYTTYSLESVHHIFDAGRYGFEALVIAGVDDGRHAAQHGQDSADIELSIRKRVPE